MTGTIISGIWRTMPMLALILAVFPAAISGKTIYVDDDAGGANDGSSWTNAYTYLQDALGDAAVAEEPVEVLVAQGFYMPDLGKNQVPGDREASFQLVNGVTLLGGFAGLGETDPDIRDVEAYATILSGDLNGNDVEVDSPHELLAEPTRSENSYHVIASMRTDDTAVLGGFIIVGGNANGRESDDSFGDKYHFMRGGGLYNVEGSPVIANCIFTGNHACHGGGLGNWKGNPGLLDCTFIWNSAGRYGGGMDNCEGEPVLTRCTFAENSASWGGGMSNRAASLPTLTDCTFKMNQASWYGGGMANVHSDTTLSGCVFRANEARLGGGIRNSDSSPTLTNCLIVDNVASSPPGLYGWSPISGRGGGMYSSKGTPTLTNCTVSRNYAAVCGGGICGHESTVVLTNCILWDNTPDQIFGDGSVSHSNIQRGWPGKGNLDADPLFVRPGRLEGGVMLLSSCHDLSIEADYHLRSRAGRWDPVREDWVADSVSSPCIDAGRPTSPTGLEPYPNGGIINMGAYGGTEEASMSPLLLVGGPADSASEAHRRWEEGMP